MDIGYVWDNDKYEAVKRKHGVYFYEVVSAFEDPKGFLEADPANHKDRWMWVGMAVTKRVLAIIGTDEDLPSFRIITAFEAPEKWVDEYEKQQ
jgi:uncharacterized protein